MQTIEALVRCCICKTSKPTSEFSPSKLRFNKTGEFYLATYCKKCFNALSAAFFAKKYKENPSHYKNAAQRCRQKYPIKVAYYELNFRTKKKGWPPLMSLLEFTEWMNSQKKICTYCDITDLSLGANTWSGRIRKFSVDRKDSSIPYIVENMCLACMTCNIHKGEFFSFDEFREIAQKYIKPKWQAKLCQ